MEINSGISLGHFSSAWFVTNASHVLRDGQIVYLKDDSGQFKKGDGVRTIGALPWLGGGSATITLTNTKILVGNASNEAAEVSLTLSPTAGSFSLSNTGVLTMPDANAITRGLLSPANFAQFNSKEPPITAGTNLQYLRGDKTFQTLNTSVVPEDTNLYFTNERVESVVNPLLALKSDLASPTFTGVATFQNIIRLTSASLGTAVAGNVEFLTDKYYGVITTGTSRKEFVLADTALTSGRLLFTTTNGRVKDSANLLFDTSNARLTIGSTTPPYQRDFVITKNNNGAVAFLVDNQNVESAAFSGFNFICGSTTFSLVNYSQGYTGNFGNTNIAVASSSYFLTASRNAKLMFAGNPIYFITGNADTNTAIGHSTTGVRIDTSINIHNAATARLHIGAGTATAGTAPLKLTSGTNLTTPENGAFEYDGTNLYFTTGGVRKTVTLV